MLIVLRTLDLRHCTLTCSVTCTLTCSVTCTLISAKNRRAAARDARGRGLPGRHSALPRVPEGGAHAETLPLHQVRHRQAAVTGRIFYQYIWGLGCVYCLCLLGTNCRSKLYVGSAFRNAVLYFMGFSKIRMLNAYGYKHTMNIEQTYKSYFVTLCTQCTCVVPCYIMWRACCQFGGNVS